jgi:hypothetical protein
MQPTIHLEGKAGYLPCPHPALHLILILKGLRSVRTLEF